MCSLVTHSARFAGPNMGPTAALNDLKADNARHHESVMVLQNMESRLRSKGHLHGHVAFGSMRSTSIRAGPRTHQVQHGSAGALQPCA